MAFVERGIMVKQSRVSFLYNYALLGLTLIFFALVWGEFNLTFTLSPQTFSQFSDSMVVLGFMAVIAILLEEPEIQRWLSHYLITNNELIKVEGIIRKRRTIIPYQSVSDVHVYKGVIGRILDFGNIEVVSFKNKITMKGVRNPELFYRIINNKISVMRGTKHAVVTVEEGMSEEKQKSEDWRKKQKSLEKKMKTLKEKKGKGRGGMRIFGLKILASDEDAEEAIREPSAEEGIEAKKKKRKRKQKKR